MRMPSHFPIRPLVLTMVIAAIALLPSPVAAQETPEPDATQDPPAPSCDKSCRGLGIEKVKAGDEHCGLVPRERKDESLDAACGLAESHREELQRLAEERARGKCDDELDQAACLCRIELRSWQNVYTHVLSQKCWTECGWASLIECERRPEADDG